MIFVIVSRLHSLSSSAQWISVPNISMLDGGAGNQDISMGITGMDIIIFNIVLNIITVY